MIIKCCIICLDYGKFKMKGSKDFLIILNPLYDNLVFNANATNVTKVKSVLPYSNDQCLYL